MKLSNKILKTALLVPSLAIVLPLVSCTIGEITPDTPTSDNAKVTFQPNGGVFDDGSSEAKYAYVEKNDLFSAFAHPSVTMANNQFNGWFDETGHKMTDQDVITQDTVLTAQWVPVVPGVENEIICTIDGQEWIASKETICSNDPETDIHLTSIETNETQDIERADFNATNVTIGQDIITLDSDFMFECSGFNGQITFAGTDQDPSKLTFINMGFMDSCTSFNSPITLPTSVKILGQSFLGSCTSFDSDLNLSNVVGIGDSFMMDCEGFSKPLIIPETVTFVSNSFMTGCNNFIHLTVNTEAANFVYDYLATLVVSEGSPAAEGVYVSGTYKKDFCTYFEEQPTEGVRNLIVA